MTALIALMCAFTAYAQDDASARIKPLEDAVHAGTATRDQQLELARLYVQSGRYYEAQQAADRILATHPNDSDVQAVRNDATTHMQQVAQAQVKQAETRAHASGATAADRLALANAYFDAGSYASAADIYARLPQNLMTPDMRLRQARALAWSGQLDASERVYSQLLRQQPTPDLQLEYGRVLSWMGAQRASIDTLRRVYTQNPTEDSAIALANALSWSNDRDQAVALLDSYVASHPGAVNAKQLADQIRSSPDIRLDQVTRLITAQPYNLALRVERARLLTDAGRYSQALDDIQFVHEHTTQNIEGLDQLQQTAQAGRQKDLAATAARLKTIDLNQVQNADEILSLAKAYTGLEDYNTAIRLYDTYLRMRPNDTDARVQYARVLSWDRRYPEAERQYQKLIAQFPDRADLQLEYAQDLSYDSDYGRAVPMFSSLTDLSSNPRANLYQDVPPKAYFNLGQIYRWYGWNDHDIEAQNRALALDSSYIPAREELDMARHLRPTSTLDGRFTQAHDSEDFTMRRVDISGEKWTSQRTAWDASIGRHDFSQFGSSASATAASGGVQYRYTDNTLLRANVGANFYDSGLGTRPFWGLGGQWMPNLQSRFAVDYNRYDLVYDVFTLGSLRTVTSPTSFALDSPLSINDFRGHYDYNSGGLLSWLADASWGRISDTNHRTAAHGLVSFRLFKEPFVAIKGEGHYLSYGFRTSRYWSPTSYDSLAGVLQVGQNIRNRVFWSVEAKLGKAWESGTSSDIRAYAANVTVPMTDMLDFVASYNYGKSGRLNSPFGSGTEFTNYWQRYWFAGIRVNGLFGKGDRTATNQYYYDASPLTGSPVVPPVGETH